MGSKAGLVKRWHEESWVNPPSSAIEAAKKYFSDDFQGFDKDGNVMTDKAAFIGVTQLLLDAFSDLKGVVHDLSEDDKGVIMTYHWEGTHTGDMDLSAMGMGVFPASGKSVKTPESKSRFLVDGDKIVGNEPISGGFELLLAAISA